MTTAQFLFTAGNIFVLPFWFLMVVLPNWSITRRVMDSSLPFVVMAATYIILFSLSLSPETARSLANPQLADVARAFADENVSATGWIHFLTLDLFVGRWIYLEGQRTGIWTVHSLLLCLFAGPMGLLSHILSVWVAAVLPAKPEDGLSTSASRN
jgi:hypothetical protein